MGLSSAIAGGIVMVTMVYVLLIMPGVVDKTSGVQDAVNEISNVEKIIYDTKINLLTISPSVGSNIVQATLANNGTEKLWNYEKFDFIITYNSTSSGKQTQSLAYSGLCGGSDPSVGKWCIDSFGNDVVDPRVLNTDETITFKGTTTQNLNTGLVIVIFSSDHGIVTTKTNILN